MAAYSVIVVGAGVIGSATAYQVVKHGMENVLLLEQVSTQQCLPRLHVTHVDQAQENHRSCTGFSRQCVSL